MQGGHNDRPQHGKVGFSRVAGVMCTATQLDKARLLPRGQGQSGIPTCLKCASDLRHLIADLDGVPPVLAGLRVARYASDACVHDPVLPCCLVV
jgi:hypothetical protein